MGTRTRDAADFAEIVGQHAQARKAPAVRGTHAQGPCELPPAPGSQRRCRAHTGGAPTGERNGQFKHGRFSRVVRAARNAEINRRARAWAEQAPQTDYGKICTDLTNWRKANDNDE